MGDVHEELAAAIVKDVVDDLRDRRGLADEWDAIDPDIQETIVDAWVFMVAKRLRGAL